VDDPIADLKKMELDVED